MVLTMVTPYIECAFERCLRGIDMSCPLLSCLVLSVSVHVSVSVFVVSIHAAIEVGVFKARLANINNKKEERRKNVEAEKQF